MDALLMQEPVADNQLFLFTRLVIYASFVSGARSPAPGTQLRNLSLFISIPKPDSHVQMSEFANYAIGCTGLLKICLPPLKHLYFFPSSLIAASGCDSDQENSTRRKYYVLTSPSSRITVMI